MRVRAYDSQLDACFCSELYAIFMEGVFERWLILQNDCLRLMNLVDREYHTQLSTIDPHFPSEWICLKNGDLLDFPDFPKHLPEDHRIAYRGYSWVWEDRDTVRTLLKGNIVPLEKTRFADRSVSSLLSGWDYVTSQTDANHLMDSVKGFHDSVLVDLHYISGSRRTEHCMLVSDSIRQVTMLFHSQWCAPFELVFEAVKGLDLRPAGNNACSSILEATLRFRDAAIFFCDGDDGGDESSYSGTKVLAYSLRWRFLPPTNPLPTSK